MVSKPSLKQVHEKWRLEAPEIAKKQKNKKTKNQATISSSQNLYRTTKVSLGAWMIIFFWMNVQNTLLFSAA